MSTTTPVSTTTPRLEIRRPAPTFTLTDLHGTSVSRQAHRGRRHLAILFFPGVDLAAREYLHDLRDRYAALREAGGDVIAVVSDSAASAEGLAAALEDLPFPVLLDPERKATASYLPDDAPFGLFILDRYGALHAQWALTAPPLPAVDEIVEWFTVLDNQCSL